MKRSASHCRRSQRPGAILVVSLVSLLIVMTMLGAMLRGALRDRRQLRTHRDLRQTELLLEAGVDRAAAQLADDPDYEGETWSLSADQIVGVAPGRVVIEATRDDGEPVWQVRVVAEYPLAGPASIRRTRTFTVQPQSALE